MESNRIKQRVIVHNGVYYDGIEQNINRIDKNVKSRREQSIVEWNRLKENMAEYRKELNRAAHNRVKRTGIELIGLGYGKDSLDKRLLWTGSQTI